jgi:hypothetical protein
VEGFLNRRRTLAGLYCAALVLVSCARGGAPSSGGARADEVTLVVGEGVAPAAPDILERVLARPAASAEPEPLFHVRRAAAADLDGVRRAPTLVLLVSMSVPGSAARAAREVLSVGEAGEVGSGNSAFFIKKDAWAPGQALLVLPGQDAVAVLSLVESRSEKIREALLSMARERVARDLFRDGEDKKSMAELSQAAGWSVRIPARGWRLDRSRAAEGVVRLESDGPRRSLAVVWAPVDSSRLAPENALALLDDLASKGGRGGVVDRASSSALPGRFGSMSALVARGVRRAAPEAGAAPFEAALFVAGSPGRLYALDREVAAGARGTASKIAMWELDAIASTFHVAGESRAAPQ